MRRRRNLAGVGLTIMSALLFGSTTVFTKSLLGVAGPATLGALTFLGAGLVGLLAAPIASVSRPLGSCTRKGRLAFIAALVLGAIIAPLLLMTGLQRTTASLASVLANIEGIATAGLAWSVFREKPSVPGVVSVIALLAGVICFTAAGNIAAESGSGPLLIGMAYLCWALDINLMRIAHGVDATGATTLRGIAGALVMGGVAWVCHETLPGGAAMGAALLTGAIGFGVSFILLLKALPIIGSAKAGAIYACAPVFGYLSSSVIEQSAFAVSTPQLIAMTLIVFGILTIGADAFARDPAPR